jgi:branched-chain amino acid transport system permease protein
MRSLTSLIPNLRRDLVFPTGGALVLFGLLVSGGLTYAGLVGGSADKLITAMLIDAVMVVGLQIYIGNTGVLSFGHIGFGAIAGYTFAVFAIDPVQKSTVIFDAPWGLNEVQYSPLVSGLIAVFVTVIVAVVVGLGLARSGAQSGAVAATVITLALLFVTHAVAVNWYEVTGGDRAGLSFAVGSTLQSRWPIYLALALSLILARVFARSRSGRLAQAAREDNLAARAMGIDPKVQQMIALLASVMVVAVAASLRVYNLGNITPRFFFFDYTLVTLVMLIVGGRNSVTGAVLGVVIMTAGRELTRRLAGDGYELLGLGLDGAPLDWLFREGLSDIFLGVAMLGFMIFRPRGLLNDWELDQWLYRRFAPQSSPSGDGDATRVPTEDADATSTGAARPTALLEAAGLTVNFGGFRALDNASITVNQDEVVGLIGPNGAGKTTLVNVITGMVHHSSGRFRLTDNGNSVDLSSAPSYTIARTGLVRTFQNLRLFSDLTVEENVEAARLMALAHLGSRGESGGDATSRLERMPSIDTLLRETELEESRHRRAAELDYGNSRRLELARAAATGPRFILLDEPTSGMSDAESLTMVERVRRVADLIGAGVLVIDHDLAFITGICDRIYCLDQGAIIAEGDPAQIQADEMVQAAYLGSGG